MNILGDLGWAYVAWSVLAIPVVIGLVVLWFFLPKEDRATLVRVLGKGSEAPLSVRMWNGWAVLGAALLYFSIPPLALETLDYVYGEAPEHVEVLRRYVLLIFTAPVLIIIVVGLLRLGSDLHLTDLGIQRKGWQLACFLGGWAWFAATPCVLGIHAVGSWLTRWYSETAPESHKLVSLVEPESTVLRWVVLIVAAVPIAAILEEFLFRGVLQRWASQVAWRSHVLFFVALVLGMNTHQAVFEQVTVFVLLLSAIYIWIGSRGAPATTPSPRSTQDTPLSEAISSEAIPQDLPRDLPRETYSLDIADVFDPRHQNPVVNRQLALLAQAALFGLIHKPWPAPIPLVVLALVLGWVMQRTNSLLGPVMLHALFNATACVLLALKHFTA